MKQTEINEILKKIRQNPEDENIIQWRNNEEFMLEILYMKRKNIMYIGDELKEDKDFMIEIIKMDVSFINFVGKELIKNSQFWIESLRVNSELLRRFTIDPIYFSRLGLSRVPYTVLSIIENVKQCQKVNVLDSLISTTYLRDRIIFNRYIDILIKIPEIIGNKYFRDLIKKLKKMGLLEDEKNWNKIEELINSRDDIESGILNDDYDKEKEERKTRKKGIEGIIENPDILERTQKGSFTKMLEVIARQPSLYPYASERLKLDKKFQDEARRLGVAQEIIDEEMEKAKAIKQAIIQKSKDARNERNKERITQQEQMRQEEKRRQEEKIKQEEKELEQTVFNSTVKEIITRLIDGRLTIYQFARNNKTSITVVQLLKSVKDEKIKIKLEDMIIDLLESQELSMMDYSRLFSENSDISEIRNNIDEFFKMIITGKIKRNKTPLGFIKERVEKFIEKSGMRFRESNFCDLKIGKIDPNTEEITWTEITNYHIELAKRYLTINDVFISKDTMSEAIFKIAKGEITLEEIEKMEEKKNVKIKGELQILMTRVEKDDESEKEALGKTAALRDKIGAVSTPIPSQREYYSELAKRLAKDFER